MDKNLPPIIIKKVKKGGGHGHHGGAWKIAYADFMTAMMAFFLLLWLLSVTTVKQRQGIANYFDPYSSANSSPGGDGVMGGESIDTTVGSMMNPQNPFSVQPVIQQGSKDKRDQKGSKTSKNKEKNGEEKDTVSKDNKNSLDNQSQKDKNEEEKNKELIDKTKEFKENLEKEKKNQEFNQMRNNVLQSIYNNPKLQGTWDNVVFEKVPEGIRLQIIDSNTKSMFTTGSTKPTPETKILLQSVSSILKKLPNKIEIAGFTDATPYKKTENYDNWDLSTGRAQATRRELMEDGIPSNRFAVVKGYGDSFPLIKSDPTSPVNRRISITILDEGKDPDKPSLAIMGQD